ncbi:hypothetical protein [Streptomyces sp. H39-S7]|uniref:hypothetical protein n=1 Tax=Streptomyces sp. H39-S7 TaxID=3004357 RepID=UPI0022AF3134|nr:hypothetical protein [Streptomyces sp. H39-S7]MCZ4117911.1 hypothetical protein [Streptomyces sp. H39-S7]
MSLSRLSAANVVLEHAPDLAEQVRLGTLGLDAAYAEAGHRKARTAAVINQHNELRQHAPDLAEQVTEGYLTLDAATAILHQRLEDERLRRRVKEVDAIRQADGDTRPSHTELAEQGAITWQEAHHRVEQQHAQRQKAIQEAQQALEQIARSWTAVQDLAVRLDTPYAHEVLDGLTPEARALATRLTSQV